MCPLLSQRESAYSITRMARAFLGLSREIIKSESIYKLDFRILLGALLVVGRKTVCSALRAVGLSEEKRFHKYQWVLR